MGPQMEADLYWVFRDFSGGAANHMYPLEIVPLKKLEYPLNRRISILPELKCHQKIE